MAQKNWGLYVTCVGHNRTEPGAEYPSKAHPDEYYFTWESGRILHEWQIGLIEKGKGEVEFKRQKVKAKAGTLIVMPPDSWHRYRPDPKTGWTTLFIGFGGDLARRLVDNAGFNPEGEVRDMSKAVEFQRQWGDAVKYILARGHNNVYSAAARVPALIAALVEEQNRESNETSHQELVHRAQSHIAEHAAEIVDFAALAESLGAPYRTLRYMFAKETGTSLLQYQLEIRLARAKNLLASSNMPIADIAATLGFKSTWYFAHFFRQRVSMAPISYRKRRRR